MSLARRLGIGLVVAGLVAGPSASVAGERKIQVVEVVSTTSVWWLEIDAPPPGASRGDAIFGSDVLRDVTTTSPGKVGKRLGKGFWRLVYETAAVAGVAETAYLRGGTVTCRGDVRSDARVHRLRIVRASGLFAGATGVCETRAAPERGPRASLKTYRLALP